MLAPFDGVTRLVNLLHRDVGHEPVGGGTVPVILPRLEVHAVTRPYDLDRPAAALAAAKALGNVNGLSEGVGVPRGAGTEIYCSSVCPGDTTPASYANTTA